MESKELLQFDDQQPATQDSPRREYRPPVARRFLDLMLDLALVSLAIIAIAMLLNPFPRLIDPPPVGVDLTFGQVLAYPSGAVVLGAALLIGTVSAVLLRLRWRTINSRLAQLECPSCGNVVLRRAKRSWYHHVLGLAGIPVYRFVCSNCGWQGTRAFK